MEIFSDAAAVANSIALSKFLHIFSPPASEPVKQSPAPTGIHGADILICGEMLYAAAVVEVAAALSEGYDDVFYA